MILVHKQPNHHALLPAIHLAHHRRNPSAPSQLTVQPTRTPGLLTLSKPKDQRHARAPSSKPARQPRQLARQSDDERETPIKPSESTGATVPMPSLVPPPPPSSPDKAAASRGRNAHPQTQSQKRSTSQAAPKRSQADAANTSDSDAPNSKSATSTPRKQRPQQLRTQTAPPPSPAAVVGPPSGRLARNRRARHKASSSEVILTTTDLVPAPADAPAADPAPATSTPAVAIPKPRRKRGDAAQPTLSRSAPLELSMSRKGVDGDHALSDWDMPAAEDEHSSDTTWQKLFHAQNGGPRTAPLTKTPMDPFSSFSPPPSPTVPRRAHKHQRSPSFPTEAMFAMSLDEDEKMSNGLAVTPLRFKNNKQVGNRFLYAGSSFLNAPNPSDLPPPSFLGTP